MPVKYERIKFLVIALKNSVEIYAWAPKPYHKFMAFKVRHKATVTCSCCSVVITVFVVYYCIYWVLAALSESASYYTKIQYLTKDIMLKIFLCLTKISKL